MYLKIKFPKKTTNSQAKKFFLKKGFFQLVKESETKSLEANQIASKNPYKPELVDLYRLYKFIVLNRRTTILEIGCGWSSLVMYAALEELHKKFGNKIKNLRRNNPFELSILDDSNQFINFSINRIKNFFKKRKLRISKTYSKSVMTTFSGRIVSEYKKLPPVNPDFIYLDGPSQLSSTGTKFGINNRERDFMPMSCDLLKIEHYLIPGTIIVVDGRTANARYLRSNFQRNWKYFEDYEHDQNVFFLDEKPLGYINKDQLKFYGFI